MSNRIQENVDSPVLSLRRRILSADQQEAEWGSKASKLREQLCEATRKFKDREVCVDSRGWLVAVMRAHVRRGDLHVTYTCLRVDTRGELYGQHLFINEKDIKPSL